MSIAVRSTHPLTIPAKTWDDLLLLEPHLRVVDRLIPMLGPERDDGRVYFALKGVIKAMVGWERGIMAEGTCDCDNPDDPAGRWGEDFEPHTAFSGLGAPAPRTSATTNAELWLRTMEAYDLAMRHMMREIGT